MTGFFIVKQLTDFLSRLIPMVPGCPQPVALQALRDAAIDFCERTMIVRHVTDPVTVRPGEPTYDIDLPSESAVVRVLNVWYGGSRLELAPAQTVTAHGAYVIGGDLGSPTAAYVLEPATVRLFPVPDARQDRALIVQAATKPTRTAKSVAAILFDDWAEAIVGGALARLAVMPGNSFSNPDMAALGASQFLAGVNAAKLEARKGRVVGDVRVIGRTFSGVRR